MYWTPVQCQQNHGEAANLARDEGPQDPDHTLSSSRSFVHMHIRTCSNHVLPQGSLVLHTTAYHVVMLARWSRRALTQQEVTDC